MPTVSQVASKNKIPIICSFADAVNKGGLACYAVDYYELGKLTAKQADKILKKEAKIESMPIEYLEEPKLVINYKKADELGIKIPEKLKGELQ
jgi:putative ABC transport system substrate-binding protein